jgi:hypothetical protein
VLVVLMLDAVGPFEIGDPEPSTVTATALTDAVRAELPRRDEVPVVVRVRDDPGLTPWAAGILDGLDADGRDVRVERAPLTEVSMWPWELTTRRRGVIFVTIRPVRAGRTSTVRVGDIAVDVTRSAR